MGIGIGEVEQDTAYRVFGQDVSAATSVTVGLGSYTAPSGTWVAPDATAYSLNGTRLDVTFTLGAGHLAAVGRVWAWVKVVVGTQTLTERLAPRSYTFLDTAGEPLVTVPPFLPVSGGAVRGVLTLRANDAAIGAPTANAAPIQLKPVTDLTAGVWQGWHSSPNGFLIHFTGDGGLNTTSASGLIGLGPSGPETGLVVDNYGVGRGIGLTNQAGSTGPGATLTNFGTGTLVEINSGGNNGGIQTGSLIVFAIPGTMPTASYGLLFKSTTGTNPEALWVDSAMQLHMSAAGVRHVTDYNSGAGLNRKTYVDADGTNFWAHQEDMTNNNWKFSQATGIALKGAETFHTLLQLQNGNALAFFGATPVAKQTAHAAGVGNYVAGTSTAVTIDGSFSGLVGSTCYTVGDIVAALKNYGLLTV